MVSFQIGLFGPGQSKPFWQSPVEQASFGTFAKGDAVFFNNHRYVVSSVAHTVVPRGPDTFCATSILVSQANAALRDGDDPVPWPWA